MDYLNEQFIGEEIDCEALGVGTIIEVTESEVKIATEYGIIELALEDVELEGEAEELEELSKSTLGSYIKSASGEIEHAAGRKEFFKGWANDKDPDVRNTGNRRLDKHNRTIEKRKKGISMAINKLTKEEVELEEGTMKPYVKPHMSAAGTQSGWKAVNKYGKVKYFGKDFKASALKHAGLNEENLEELSKATLGNYVKKSALDVASKSINVGMSVGDGSDTSSKIRSKTLDKILSRTKGINKATDKLTKEEVEELEEGRGRKPKQPKEGEKPTAAWLRHLERQKNDKPEKEEVEALGAQLRKAVSINKPVTFMNGEKKEVTAGHAELFHDHMAARKMTADKQKFQNDAHASHDAFMKAIKAPIPGK